MKRKLLVIDFETGGFDPATNAIMSLAAVVYHDGPEESVYMLIKDPEGLVEDEACRVNGITQEDLDREGLTPWEAVMRLEALLQKNDMRARVTLVGQHLPFDVPFLKRLYRLAGLDFTRRFERGGIDTRVAAMLLMQVGRLNCPSPSLIDVAPAVGVKLDGPHHALNDAMATAKTLRKLLDMIRRPDWSAHPVKSSPSVS